MKCLPALETTNLPYYLLLVLEGACGRREAGEQESASNRFALVHPLLWKAKMVLSDWRGSFDFSE